MSVSTKNEKPKINDKLVEQQIEMTEKLCYVKKHSINVNIDYINTNIKTKVTIGVDRSLNT